MAPRLPSRRRPQADNRQPPRPAPAAPPPPGSRRAPAPDEKAPAPDEREGRPCECKCDTLDTITDRVVFRGQEMYFNYKVRTFCGVDRSKAPPAQKPIRPDDRASELGPETKCYWTVKFWRDTAGGEPQSDSVTITHIVLRREGVVKFYLDDKAVPATGALEASYPAAFGCEAATLNAVFLIGDATIPAEDRLMRRHVFRGCRPCLKP